VNGKIIKYMDKECIIGLMVEDILVNGKMVWWMAKVNIVG
jgi:hypothetical protein